MNAKKEAKDYIDQEWERLKSRFLKVFDDFNFTLDKANKELINEYVALMKNLFKGIEVEEIRFQTNNMFISEENDESLINSENPTLSDYFIFYIQGEFDDFSIILDDETVDIYNIKGNDEHFNFTREDFGDNYLNAALFFLDYVMQNKEMNYDDIMERYDQILEIKRLIDPVYVECPPPCDEPLELGLMISRGNKKKIHSSLERIIESKASIDVEKIINKIIKGKTMGWKSLIVSENVDFYLELMNYDGDFKNFMFVAYGKKIFPKEIDLSIVMVSDITDWFESGIDDDVILSISGDLKNETPLYNIMKYKRSIIAIKFKYYSAHKEIRPAKLWSWKYMAIRIKDKKKEGWTDWFRIEKRGKGKKFNYYIADEGTKHGRFRIDDPEEKWEKGVQGIAYLVGVMKSSGKSIGDVVTEKDWTTQAIRCEYKDIDVKLWDSMEMRIVKFLKKYREIAIAYLQDEYSDEIKNIRIVPKPEKDFKATLVF